MQDVQVSTIIEEANGSLVVFTNGASCHVPHVRTVMTEGPPGPPGPPGMGGTVIENIRVENDALVYEVRDGETGERRELRAAWPKNK